MNTEQRLATQHFDVPVLKVEGAVGGYSRGVEGGLVIRGICNCEVGQADDADRRGVSDGGFRNVVLL